MKLFSRTKQPIVGIICDLTYSRHHLFKSYYYAIKNIYEQVKLVEGVDDLQGLTHLVIGDDHYGPHKRVWKNDFFISYCNKNKIKVIVLTNEKVTYSYFPWNFDLLQELWKFKYLYHYMNDVDDCKIYRTKLNRTAPSTSFLPTFQKARPKEKRKALCFIGKVTCPMHSYDLRNLQLEKLEKLFPIDIYQSTIPTWEDYLKIIAKYQYVYSPLGNGNFFPMRFYEILALGSIPVHQVKKDTLEYYDIEAKMPDCIFFTNVEEVPEKINNFTFPGSFSTYWMENNLLEHFKKDGLL